MIAPTPGRTIWAHERVDSGAWGNPCDALIHRVNDDGTLDVWLLKTIRAEFHAGVTLVQPGGEPPADGGIYCEWMPFQVVQEDDGHRPAATPAPEPDEPEPVADSVETDIDDLL